VSSQEFWLRLGEVRKLRRQHLRRTLMDLLPGTPEQRLVGNLLDEGMLEGVCGLW
jgi:hypothetical protein